MFGKITYLSMESRNYEVGIIHLVSLCFKRISLCHKSKSLGGYGVIMYGFDDQ